MKTLICEECWVCGNDYRVKEISENGKELCYEVPFKICPDCLRTLRMLIKDNKNDVDNPLKTLRINNSSIRIK